MRIVYTHEGKESAFETDKRKVVIGRAKPDLVIDLDLTPDKTVSRPHAMIWAEGSRFFLEDLNSSRGTLLNGEEIKGTGRRPILPGDTVRIGDTTLVIEVPEQEPVPEAEPPRLLGGDITQTLDASAVLFAGREQSGSDIGLRLAMLYDLPLQLGIEHRLESVLQTIVERLIGAVPKAARGAVLVEDPATGQLLLKAHLPAGDPEVSLSLARQAMEHRQGFTWKRGQDPDVTVAISGQAVSSGMYAPLLWKEQALGVICAVNYDSPDAFTTDDLKLLLALAHYAAMAVIQRAMQEELRANASLLHRLMTNFSPKVRERLLTSARGGRMRLGGQKSEVTILISDIRSFTRLSAGMDSEDVVDMLNDYFSALVEVVFKFDGTVDKFIGDAMLVIFGSPEPDAQQHEKAVRAALAMRGAIEAVSAARRARGQTPCEMGIGLHSGEVLHGFIGSSERMEFTVIGDAVNRATRYCDAAAPGEILISPEVHQWVWRKITSEPVTVTIKHEGQWPAFRLKGLRG